MRRKEFVSLVGLSESALNLLLARKHVPLRGRSGARGWLDYSVDDALALEAALALARNGATKREAREWVDLYLSVAIEHASERQHKGPIYLGAAQIVSVKGALVCADDAHPIVGDASQMAEQLADLSSELGPQHQVSGAIFTNLNLCLSLVVQRADAARLAEPRLLELQRWFG